MDVLPDWEEAHAFRVFRRTDRQATTFLLRFWPKASLEQKALVELQKRLGQFIGGGWLPVLDVGSDEEGLWAVYPYGLVPLSRWLGTITADAGLLRSVVTSIVNALDQLETTEGRPHGNLSPSQILLGGEGPLAGRRLFLAEPVPEQRIDQSPYRNPDLRSLGELIFMLANRSIRVSPDLMAVPEHFQWPRLGAEERGWKRVCSELLDPQGRFQSGGLVALRQEMESFHGGRRFRKALLVASALVLLPTAVFFGLKMITGAEDPVEPIAVVQSIDAALPEPETMQALPGSDPSKVGQGEHRQTVATEAEIERPQTDPVLEAGESEESAPPPPSTLQPAADSQSAEDSGAAAEPPMSEPAVGTAEMDASPFKSEAPNILGELPIDALAQTDLAITLEDLDPLDSGVTEDKAHAPLPSALAEDTEPDKVLTILQSFRRSLGDTSLVDEVRERDVTGRLRFGDEHIRFRARSRFEENFSQLVLTDLSGEFSDAAILTLRNGVLEFSDEEGIPEVTQDPRLIAIFHLYAWPFLAPLPAYLDSFPLHYVGHEAVRGTEFKVLEYSQSGGFRIRFFFDPESGHLRFRELYARGRRAGPVIHEEFLNHQLFNGINFPQRAVLREGDETVGGFEVAEISWGEHDAGGEEAAEVQVSSDDANVALHDVDDLIGAAGDQADPIFRLSDVDVRPRPFFQSQPPMPPSLEQPERVRVRYIVRSDGSTSDIAVVESTMEELNEDVIESISNWRFSPGLIGGDPVSTRVFQTINFDPSALDAPPRSP